MKKINKYYVIYLATLLLISLTVPKAAGQSTMPDELLKSSMNDQFKYIEEKTRIYENYRAIREDMFQKLVENMSDTLKERSSIIKRLNGTVAKLNNRNDTLAANLETTKTSLQTAVSSKNSIPILGREVNKATYNSIMWLTIIGLAVILAMLFLSLKRSLTVAHNAEKELKDLRDEYQAYKKTSREAREKMSMDHFNELKKLKGG